jgi:hypothetical protein
MRQSHFLVRIDPAFAECDDKVAEVAARASLPYMIARTRLAPRLWRNLRLQPKAAFSR